MQSRPQGEVPPVSLEKKEVSRTQLLLGCTSFDDLYVILGKEYPEHSTAVSTIKEVRDSKRSILDIPHIPGLPEKVIELLASDHNYRAPVINL